MKSLIRRIIKEYHGPTETEPLFWKIPKKMVDELGFELYNQNDVVYIQEIHFDTQNVLFSFYTTDLGEETHYDDTPYIPGSFEGYKTIPIKELPKNVLFYILRRLDEYYRKYLDI